MGQAQWVLEKAAFVLLGFPFTGLVVILAGGSVMKYWQFATTTPFNKYVSALILGAITWVVLSVGQL